MQKSILKISYFVIPVLVILIAFVDLLSYYSNLYIVPVAYIRELVIIAILLIWYYVLKNKLHFDELNIEQNLIRLFLFIAANFIIAVILNAAFNPLYSGGFPPSYQSPSAIIVSTVIALTAAITLVPIILIFKQLIFHKRKKRTALFFNLFLAAIAINALIVFYTRESVGWFRFARETLLTDISMTFTLLIIFILSFRNEWITYLSGKKKLIYFIAGLILYVAIASLFDFVYRTPLPAYSLTLAALTYSLWMFLLFYGGLALFKLFIHLPTARAFDRKIRELNSLYHLGRKLNREVKLSKLLPLITQLTEQIMGCNSTWLALYDEKEGRFRIAAQLNLTKQQIKEYPLTGFSGFNRDIVSRKETILISDVSHNRIYHDLLNWKRDARTILGVPLFSNRGQLMGIIYATKNREYTFDIDDASLLQGLANQAAMALENANLLQESIERERLEQELKIAREVQLKLLPQALPDIPGLDIEAYCLSAYEVGGDYYDFFNFPDGQPGIVIGDVAGKGTSAALYMAEFKGVIQTLARIHNSPAALANAANRVIYPNIDRRSFVSAIIAKIDPTARRITFVRAGHPPVLFCPGNGKPAQKIHSRGLGFGLDSGKIFENLLEEKTIEIQPGGIIIFYTDGVIEARNSRGEEFSEERLLELLQNCDSDSAEKIKENLMNAVIRFCEDTPLHDDLTFVILRCCKEDS